MNQWNTGWFFFFFKSEYIISIVWFFFLILQASLNLRTWKKMSLACILKSHTLVFTYSLCPFIFVEDRFSGELKNLHQMHCSGRAKAWQCSLLSSSLTGAICQNIESLMSVNISIKGKSRNLNCLYRLG